MSLAYCFGFFRLTRLANVKRSTVGHLNVDSVESVWFSFCHASRVCGWHVFLNVVSFGEHSEMYSCVGSLLSRVSASGFVPFVTRKVVKPCLVKQAISSPS